MGSPRRGEQGERAERSRSFDAKAKDKCWAKAEVVPGRHPERWRKDAAGNVVCRRFFNCLGCLCYEYDHIVPFSKGGDSTEDNCQILQTRVNRFKSDKESLEKTDLKDFSCDIKFTDKELDVIEMAVYGDVIRPGKQCSCKTVAEMLGKYKSKNSRIPLMVLHHALSLKATQDVEQCGLFSSDRGTDPHLLGYMVPDLEQLEDRRLDNRPAA